MKERLLRFNSSHVIKTRLKQKRQVAAADGARCPAAPDPLDVQLRKPYKIQVKPNFPSHVPFSTFHPSRLPSFQSSHPSSLLRPFFTSNGKFAMQSGIIFAVTGITLMYTSNSHFEFNERHPCRVGTGHHQRGHVARQGRKPSIPN